MIITIDLDTLPNHVAPEYALAWVRANGLDPLDLGLPVVVDTAARTVTAPYNRTVDRPLRTYPIVVDPPVELATLDHTEHRCPCGAHWPKDGES